jgi:hypothetical protein
VIATVRHVSPDGMWLRIDRVDNSPAEAAIVFLERYLCDLAFEAPEREAVQAGSQVRLVVRSHERGGCLYRAGTLIRQPIDRELDTKAMAAKVRTGLARLRKLSRRRARGR